ncbi:MAG: ABC transporter ATP-binding protein [Xanthobacteraceae bacterium]|jgi:ABC-2 type transport system ATP-binding protein
MSSPIVQAQNLIKWYGPRLAVRDVSFSVAEGEVVGLLGPNGSGKSTIFRILTGYIAPSSGAAWVAGHEAGQDSLALRQVVGYVPEDAPLYDHMRVAEFLRFMARLKGLAGRDIAARIDAVASRLQLEKVLGLPVAKLSRGYRQRVSIAQALLNEPRLLVLDEPTSGLDPSQVIAVRDLIRDLAGKQTVLIASHVLSEIELIADRVMILLDGRLLTTDALAQAARTRRLRLQVAGAEQDVRARIGAVPGVGSIATEPGTEAGSLRYVVEADARQHLARDVAAALVSGGFALSELVTVPPDLERIFLDLTRRPEEAAA